MNSQFPITASHLVKRFGSFTAVNDVSFDVGRGEIMGFIGPNGAGKSTTIRILCGLLRPTSGTAKIAGIDIVKAPEQARSQIGYMSQKFSLYADLTASENLRFFGGIYRVAPAELKDRMAYAINMAGLAGRENDLVSHLAGGWKQRLALGCAILHRPPIVFLDEPTSGVDPLSRRRFWDLIHDLASDGVTIIVTTHYMDEAEYCDRIALIDQGCIIAMGSPSSLKKHSLGGVLLQVTGEQIASAIASLKGKSGIHDVAVFGNALHVLAGNDINPDDLAAFLRSNGSPDVVVTPIPPSLEDVFVSLVTQPAAGPAT